MKTVLANHQEVCHFWANKIQFGGKSGNMFFRDNTIFSYGEHFPIARHDGLNTVLFTTKGYSPSTSKHVAYTRQAIPADKKIIYVRDVMDGSTTSIYADTVRDNLTAIQNTIINTLKKSFRARERKPYYLHSAQRDLDNMGQYITLRKSALGKAVKEYEIFLANTRAGIDTGEIQAAIAEQVKREEAAEKKRIARIKRENAKKIQQWINGETTYCPRLDHALLRINTAAGTIETSERAEVTIQEGKALWHRIKQGKPIIGQILSGYTVLSFNGELKIGCHIIERAEVDRIGALLDTMN